MKILPLFEAPDGQWGRQWFTPPAPVVVLFTLPAPVVVLFTLPAPVVVLFVESKLPKID